MCCAVLSYPYEIHIHSHKRRVPMSYVTVGKENSGDIEIYYKDWGSGQPVGFSHGWPLSAHAFEDQMFFLASRGYRRIAHDRRSQGRSSQPWNGNDLTPTLTISRRLSKRSTCRTQSMSVTPRAVVKSPV